MLLNARIVQIGSYLVNEKFCTPLQPYEFGIIDAISQALLPGIAKATHTVKYTNGNRKEIDLSAWPERYGIIAELYKRNISTSTSSDQRCQVVD